MRLIEQRHCSRGVDVECGCADRVEVTSFLEPHFIGTIAPPRTSDPGIGRPCAPEDVLAEIDGYGSLEREAEMWCGSAACGHRYATEAGSQHGVVLEARVRERRRNTMHEPCSTRRLPLEHSFGERCAAVGSKVHRSAYVAPGFGVADLGPDAVAVVGERHFLAGHCHERR